MKIDLGGKVKPIICHLIGHKPKTGFAGEWVTWCVRCGEILGTNHNA